jgi:hypothetical protein
MDGAVGDGLGPPFPIVCTTEKGNGRSNLRRSLQRYRDEGGPRDKAIFATSRSLSAKDRQRLSDAASKFEIVLVQTYDQDAIAARLYREPQWCRDLLGLTGSPPALSIFPATTRPLIGDTVVGRDKDLDWLASVSGDAVVSGQPGSGKTLLVYEHSRRAKGLFVVNDDCTRIAEEIRAKGPKLLIVDDAHTTLPLLTRLVHMRKELYADFRIVATSWPSDAEHVTGQLRLPGTMLRRLSLLTRDQIAEVVKSAGIEQPNWVIREIVTQAEGLPGLAVTLARACVNGDWEEVLRGRKLTAHVRSIVGHDIAERALSCLALLALAGDAGLKLEFVASSLEIPFVDVRGYFTNLAAAGIVHEKDDAVVVRPPPLRGALVRDFFFSGPTSIPLPRLPSETLGDTTLSIIDAKRLGAMIPDELIFDFVCRADSAKAWERYGWLGEHECGRVLKDYPSQFRLVRHAALAHIAAQAIPLLLTAAVDDDRALHSHTDHPLRIIQDWAHDPRRREDPISNRQVLFSTTCEWAKQGGQNGMAYRAFGIALSPAVQFVESDPGSGHSVTISSGVLPLKCLRQLAEIWTEVVDFIKCYPPTSWAGIRKLVEAWASPSDHGHRSPPSDAYEFMQHTASKMLQDVLELGRHNNGVVYWVARTAHTVPTDLTPSFDPDFSALFPLTDPLERHRFQVQQLAHVRALAEDWRAVPVDVGVSKLCRFEREIREAGHVWPDYRIQFCQRLAELVESPLAWAEALSSARAHPSLVFEFVRAGYQQKEPGVEAFLRKLIQCEDYRLAAVLILLRDSGAVPNLLSLASASIRGAGSLIEGEALLGRLPVQTLRSLLLHDDDEIATAAAIGEWERFSHGGAPTAVPTEWRAAIVRCTTGDSRLAEILRSNRSLAIAWLEQQISTKSDCLYGHDDATSAAVGTLAPEDRRALLRCVPAEYQMKDLLKALIENDIEAYSILLSMESHKAYHLVPLEQIGGAAWADMAKLAMRQGFSPKEIAENARMAGGVWVGKFSNYEKSQLDAFEQLLEHPDSGVRSIAEFGHETAKARYKRELEREHREEVYGRD